MRWGEVNNNNTILLPVGGSRPGDELHEYACYGSAGAVSDISLKSDGPHACAVDGRDGEYDYVGFALVCPNYNYNVCL